MSAITDTPKTTPEFREWFCHRIGHEFTGISIEECDFAACFQAGLTHARGEAEQMRALLIRISKWDMMDCAADGPFWQREIADAIAEQTNGEVTG